MGNLLTIIALLGFLVVGPGLFAVLSPRRAVIAGLMLAWLFLPVAGLEIQGLPDISKTYVSTLGVVLGVLLFDPGRLLMFRPRWFDAPMLLWCFVPLLSSITSGLGLYDGMSSVLKQIMQWGLPYYLGRIYFTDSASLRDLAVGVVIGGAIYAPLCIWEWRMAPTLHHTLYGYHPHSFAQHIRGGGYRPMVFMQHGLMVAMWMTWATVCAVWLWRSGAIRSLWGVPIGLVVGLLAVAAVLCKSVGPLGLLVVGVALFYWLRTVKMAWPIWGLIILVPLYVGLRASGAWSGSQAVSVASALFGAERAASLNGRIVNETLLVDKALERPVFGWGMADRWRVKDEWGRDISTSDGLWVIALGQHGAVGLLAITAATLLPLIMLLWRCPVQYWTDPRLVSVSVLAVLLGLWAIDNLLNAMVHPLYVLAMGGVSTVCALRWAAAPASVAARTIRRGGLAVPAAATRTASIRAVGD